MYVFESINIDDFEDGSILFLSSFAYLMMENHCIDMMGTGTCCHLLTVC